MCLFLSTKLHKFTTGQQDAPKTRFRIKPFHLKMDLYFNVKISE